MMSIFVNPLLWPFLALAAAPLVLHLLSLRRLPTIDLSTYRFLFDTYVQQRRRIKLLEYLLLLLRTLFLALLVLALMRPMQERWGNLFGSAGRSVFLLVDCSASMGVQAAGVSSLDRAKQAALTVAKKLPAGDRVTLVRVIHRPEVVLSQFGADSAELAEAIQNLQSSVSAGNVHAALSTALTSDRSGGLPRSAYLFTDMQKSGWKQVVDQQGGKLAAGEDRLFVLNVGQKDVLSNHAVLGDSPSDADCIVGQPIELRPRIANFSEAPLEATVRVEVDGKEIGRFPIKMQPGKTTTRRLTFVPDQPGVLKGKFVIERDRFDADDEFLFCLNVAGPARVLLVNGKPDADPFKDELIYLRAALRSRYVEETTPAKGAGSTGKSLRTLDAGSLSIEEVRDGDWNQERLAGLGVVVLANCQQFSTEQVRELREFVERGGGLILFPGDRVGGGYRELLESRGLNEPPLLTVKMDPPRGDEQSRKHYERLAALDYGHPILSVFRPSEGREYLTTPRFFRHHPISMLKDDRSCFALAQFGSNEPAIVEGRYGKGIVLLAAFPINSDWSNLPLVGADFVPLMLRMVSYARRKADLYLPSATAPGGVIPITAAERLEEPLATVTGPDGAPETVKLVPGSGDIAGKFERTNAKGYYQVELDAREPAPRRRDQYDQRKAPDRRFHASAGFAVNTAADESDFAPLPGPEVRNLLGDNATYIDLSASSASVEEELTQKQEIWRWLVYLMLAVFVGEFTLATLRGPRTNAEQSLDAEKGSWFTQFTGVRPMETKE